MVLINKFDADYISKLMSFIYSFSMTYLTNAFAVCCTMKRYEAVQKSVATFS